VKFGQYSNRRSPLILFLLPLPLARRGKTVRTIGGRRRRAKPSEPLAAGGVEQNRARGSSPGFLRNCTSLVYYYDESQIHKSNPPVQPPARGRAQERPSERNRQVAACGWLLERSRTHIKIPLPRELGNLFLFSFVTSAMAKLGNKFIPENIMLQYKLLICCKRTLAWLTGAL